MSALCIGRRGGGVPFFFFLSLFFLLGLLAERVKNVFSQRKMASMGDLKRAGQSCSHNYR